MDVRFVAYKKNPDNNTHTHTHTLSHTHTAASVARGRLSLRLHSLLQRAVVAFCAPLFGTLHAHAHAHLHPCRPWSLYRLARHASPCYTLMREPSRSYAGRQFLGKYADKMPKSPVSTASPRFTNAVSPSHLGDVLGPDAKWSPAPVPPGGSLAPG